MNELEFVIFAMQVMIAPISISIAIIALKSYLRFRNWRFLFLSLAFFILSIPPLFVIFPILFNSNQYSHFFYVASVLPFALLAFVYFDERRKQSIKITRSQWIIGGLPIIAYIILLSYILIPILGRMDLASEFGLMNYLNLIEYISGSIGYLLIILIVMSLFSYYRVKRTVNTLVVMIGFICLLFSHGFGLIYFVSIFIPRQDLLLEIGLMRSFELAGYIAFLAALVRLKVLR